jgi:hypothetical protein
VKRELEWIEIPGEHEARERAWNVARAAFAEREPSPRHRSWKPAAALAAAAVALAGLLSPPGRAVLDDIREAVGVEGSQPALFSLPAPGRLLVVADSGVWVVAQDGSKRRLGAYRDASWSPFGRFLVASRRNELVALTPDGDVRWSLARPNVRFARWGGSESDTRIAYLSDGQLRVVGGDGRGDRLLDDQAAPQPPVWQAAPARHLLAYARRDGRVRIVDVDSRSVVSPNAKRAVLAPDERREAQEVLGAAADIAAPVRSPDGRWLAVGWPEADQLVFIRTRGGRQLRAVSNVSAQFRSRAFPTIGGWCCAP